MGQEPPSKVMGDCVLGSAVSKYVALGGQHTVKVLMRAERLENHLALVMWLVTAWAEILKLSVPMDVCRPLVGSHHLKQSQFFKMPLCRWASNLLSMLEGSKLADRVQLATGWTRFDHHSDLMREYRHVAQWVLACGSAAVSWSVWRVRWVQRRRRINRGFCGRS